MTTLYLIAAILGIGLLVLSSLGVGDADATIADVPDLDTPAGEFLLGIFSTRNLTFFLAAFGASGLLVGWLGGGTTLTLLIALALGFTALVAVHGVFTWLRRSDSSVEILGDRDFEGALGRVTLPISAGVRGQVACTVAGREEYLTAALAADVPGPLAVGQEVIVLSTEGGLARVMPASSTELPSST